jgi:hypothetical protein
MSHLLLQADALLRGDPPARGAAPRLRQLALLVLVSGLFYGAVMGTFGGVAGERVWQVVFSAVKVPLLLLTTFLIALPSFFVFSTLLGLRCDFPAVLRALLGSQAGLAVVLAGLAPYTALWYVSSASYPAAILFNGLMFAVASGAAQAILRRAYRPLIARDRRHRWLLWTWVILYVFVGIQMAWVLRPFVGDPSMRTRFFREDTWGNAYLIVGRTFWEVVRR